MTALLRGLTGGAAAGTRRQELRAAGHEGQVSGRASCALQEVAAGPLLQEPLELSKTAVLWILVSAHLLPPLSARLGPACRPLAQAMLMSSSLKCATPHLDVAQR